MGKYDEFKRLTLPLSVVKKFFSTRTSQPGLQATGGHGNEGIVLAEWIQERIDDGTIDPGSTPTTGTNLTNTSSANTVTIISDTGTDTVITAATTTLAGVMTSSDKNNLTSLITLSGVPALSTNLGVFTGSIIPNNVDIKTALQSLETQLETFPILAVGDISSVDNAITVTNGLSSVINGDTTFQFNPANVDLSDIGGSLNLDQLNSTGATIGQIITFNGTEFVASTYTPPTIAHNDTTSIQGGIADEYYHLNQEVYDSIYNLSAGELLGQASYLGAPQVQAITLGDSIAMNLTTGVITLVNDTASPGNSKYYGTDGSGIRGWYSSSVAGTVTNLSATNSADLTFTITNPTTTPDITAILTNTGVIAGTYGTGSNVSTFTVNSKGRITSAIDTPISISSTNVSNFDEAVDDRVNSLLVAGTNVTLVYDDTANTLTINSASSGTVDGTGIADTVAFWADTNTLDANLNFKFDGDYITMGNPTSISLSRLTTKGTGSTLSTYGIVHQNSAGNEVFKVADNGAVTIGVLGDVYIHPDQMNISAGGEYAISKSGGDLKLYSDTTVLVESGDTASNTPSFKSIATRSTSIGDVYNVQIEGTFATTGSSNRYTDLYINTDVNQIGGTSPIRSIYIKPTLTSATNYAGIEIDAPSHTALRTTAGDVRFDLGSDATGDILYRDADGNLARLPVGASDQVLGSTGTIPAWTTTAGSLPGGSEGDILLYSGGNWTASSIILSKQTGITGLIVTLGVAPVNANPALFQLYKNGVLLDEVEDFTRSGTTITMAAANTLIASDKITAIYYS